MRFGALLPHAGHAADPDALVDVALAAERAGFRSVWAGDHVMLPHSTSEYPYADDGNYQLAADRPFLEAFTTLAHVAARTERIHCGVGVCVVPHRPIPLLAKTAATLDFLSGGRFLLGVGSGWSRPEIEGLGMPFERRGAFTDEALDFCRAAWTATDGRLTYRGEFVDVEAMHFVPRPAREGRLPVWVGGRGAAARRRAARFGDVWFPPLWNASAESLAAGIAEVRAIAEDAGRADADAIELAVVCQIAPGERIDAARSGTLAGSPAELARQIDELAAAGVADLVLLLGGSGRRRVQLIERLAEEVLPLLSS